VKLWIFQKVFGYERPDVALSELTQGDKLQRVVFVVNCPEANLTSVHLPLFIVEPVDGVSGIDVHMEQEHVIHGIESLETHVLVCTSAQNDSASGLLLELPDSSTYGVDHLAVVAPTSHKGPFAVPLVVDD